MNSLLKEILLKSETNSHRIELLKQLLKEEENLTAKELVLKKKCQNLGYLLVKTLYSYDNEQCCRAIKTALYCLQESPVYHESEDCCLIMDVLQSLESAFFGLELLEGAAAESLLDFYFSV
ncbi:MAG: hypothetical protein ACI976_001367 [Aureispira sp.]|jgi:hypothetical protein